MWLLLLAFIKLAELRSCANTEINVIFHRQTDSLNRISYFHLLIWNLISFFSCISNPLFIYYLFSNFKPLITVGLSMAFYAFYTII